MVHDLVEWSEPQGATQCNMRDKVKFGDALYVSYFF